jgi:hypothetical protein
LNATGAAVDGRQRTATITVPVGMRVTAVDSAGQSITVEVRAGRYTSLSKFTVREVAK